MSRGLGDVYKRQVCVCVCDQHFKKISKESSFVTQSVPHSLTFMWWGCCGLFLCHKPTELAHSFFFFCLYGPFNCISFHELYWQLSAFSPCSSGRISALLVFSTIYLYESLPQPWYNPLRLTGLKALTNHTKWFLIKCSTYHSHSYPQTSLQIQRTLQFTHAGTSWF